MSKSRRIRDPLYDLIEFNDHRIEDFLWKIVQTPSFQRLRRIKQLGFSDYVYPGATHSRFSHSLGVFHIAKKLIFLIKKQLGRSDYNEEQANCALAAALVHDIGHGPYSHAFEKVGMTSHEEIGSKIIKETEVHDIFERYNEGFSTKVSNLILAKGSPDIYGSVVSSQFDADRLDYIQRDRFMAGTHLGGIDFSWLLANLEIGKITSVVDETGQDTKETFVLNPKAIHAAEAYVLSLFQLYPTLYFHKATRCLEKIFCKLLERLFFLVNNGDLSKTGLNKNHPLILFTKKPKDLKRFLDLDDSVIVGSLSLLKAAKDPIIVRFAQNLHERNLYKCFDFSDRLADQSKKLSLKEQEDLFNKTKLELNQRIAAWIQEEDKTETVFTDDGAREPYKNFSGEGTGSPLNQIRVKTNAGKTKDIRDESPIICAINPFRFYRIYVDRGDQESLDFVENLVKEYSKRGDGTC